MLFPCREDFLGSLALDVIVFINFAIFNSYINEHYNGKKSGVVMKLGSVEWWLGWNGGSARSAEIGYSCDTKNQTPERSEVIIGEGTVPDTTRISYSRKCNVLICGEPRFVHCLPHGACPHREAVSCSLALALAARLAASVSEHVYHFQSSFSFNAPLPWAGWTLFRMRCICIFVPRCRLCGYSYHSRAWLCSCMQGKRCTGPARKLPHQGKALPGQQDAYTSAHHTYTAQHPPQVWSEWDGFPGCHKQSSQKPKSLSPWLPPSIHDFALIPDLLELGDGHTS